MPKINIESHEQYLALHKNKGKLNNQRLTH